MPDPVFPELKLIACFEMVNNRHYAKFWVDANNVIQHWQSDWGEGSWAYVQKMATEANLKWSENEEKQAVC